MGEHLPCKQGVKSSNLFISIYGFAAIAGGQLFNKSWTPVYIENYIVRSKAKKRNKRVNVSYLLLIIIKKRRKEITKFEILVKLVRAQGECLGASCR